LLQAQFHQCYLDGRLQVHAKHIQSTQVESNDVQIFKDLNITMVKYALYSYFHAIDIDFVDVVLGYPWMDLIQ
jgi:hypothetical protein